MGNRRIVEVAEHRLLGSPPASPNRGASPAIASLQPHGSRRRRPADEAGIRVGPGGDSSPERRRCDDEYGRDPHASLPFALHASLGLMNPDHKIDDTNAARGNVF